MMRTTIRIEVETSAMFGAINKSGVEENYKGYVTIDSNFLGV